MLRPETLTSFEARVALQIEIHLVGVCDISVNDKATKDISCFVFDTGDSVRQSSTGKIKTSLWPSSLEESQMMSNCAVSHSEDVNCDFTFSPR